MNIQSFQNLTAIVANSLSFVTVRVSERMSLLKGTPEAQPLQYPTIYETKFFKFPLVAIESIPVRYFKSTQILRATIRFYLFSDLTIQRSLSSSMTKWFVSLKVRGSEIFNSQGL